MTNRVLWIMVVAALACAASAVLAWYGDTGYLPPALMFVAALLALGILMTFEDRLLARYDTPHDDQKHPPVLIMYRAARVLILLVMGILVFVLAF